jgi:hypothetical protein
VNDELPGADLVEQGLADLASRRVSVPSLLVAIAAESLRRAGLAVPEAGIARPERRLYELLAETDPDSAHSRYNALLRRLVSFERALRCAAR